MINKKHIKKTSILFCFLSILALASCMKDPKSVVIPNDTSVWNKELKPYVKQLSEEEKILLENFLNESKKTGFVDLSSLTIGEAIEYQRTKEKEEAAKSQKEAAEKKRFEDLISKGIIVEFKGKEPIYRTELKVLPDAFKLKLNFVNNTGKDISGFKGSVDFFDIFNARITSIDIEVEENIGSGKFHEWDGTVKLNNSSYSDNLYYTEDEKIRVEFSTEVIIFADGETIKKNP